MKEERIYVDVHVLQTVPPSCVNRDDTGSPKTAIYGGVRRARISSQSWKHAVRCYFRDHLDEQKLAYRTKNADAKVADYLVQYGMSQEEAKKSAVKALKDAKIIASEDGKKNALFFISDAQARAVASAINSGADNEEIKKALSETPGIEIALFGRMVADNTALGEDACCQVAHAISTHKVSNEYDYFTAVDDIQDDDASGAGHIGSNEFNSATLYRYATVAVHDLANSLGTDTAQSVCDFLEAFVKSMPTGKMNSYANRTIPDAVLVTIRNDQPVNFVGAFEEAVNPDKQCGGYVSGSEKKLEMYVLESYKDFIDSPLKSFVVGNLDDSLGEKVSFGDLLLKVKDVLVENLS
ncbi:MAG: type I-E CRISPR-associated protein Cas7/Cse4/CasC [Clostridiales bacterium]|nr:type I-E CRISPR-associated protein Cas7/Cse4/CasC [Clostridiales bacterium]